MLSQLVTQSVAAEREVSTTGDRAGEGAAPGRCCSRNGAVERQGEAVPSHCPFQASSLPGVSQPGHVWEPELCPFHFPLRWTALGWAVCVSKTWQRLPKRPYFFPLIVFSNADSGNGEINLKS